MSSVTGDMVADPGEVAYATSKAALVGFTKSLAVELAPLGITVNAICPGYVLTPMAEAIAKQSNAENPDAVLRGIANAVPLKRLADPTEVGHLAAFLASPGAAYITGAQMVIDGGSTLPETVSVGV
jgi:NAD(P)-dependent dehydrogenase (short-subunit alcohol dehydrogenase family)